ncbi:MAG: hypothetical protein CR975_04065 [Gammaproteobacteria bacterium]|nr:MAG: hypothetical protein CR975_04065 [Gammaproteobacteria bacterium]
MTNSRFVHCIETDHLAEAKVNITAACHLSCLTVIDTTTDFNQNKWLGQELDHTLIYIHSNSKINGILAVCGCVRGGCHLFFVFKRERYSPFYRDFFIPRLKQISEKQQSLPCPCQKNKAISSTINLASLINQVKKTVKTGQATHIIGARGTGKSTLLGQYMREICQTENSYVVLLSRSRLSASNALKYLDNVSRETFRFITPSSPDLSILEVATHIVIDEAATINRSLLNKIYAFNHQAIILLATTTDGYEGTGQSYRLSYLKNNDKVIHLTEPKRFSANDPLYLLSQKLCQPNRNDNRSSLAEGVALFSAKELQEKGGIFPVFSLLQRAHYRTTPNDFANFYDNNGLFIAATQDKQIIGATYVLEESLPQNGKDLALIEGIINGRRRVKNAMTQQALIHAYGYNGHTDNLDDDIATTVADKKILRISRIAVSEGQRRQGVATAMLEHLSEYAQQHRIDFISTSFSGRPDTLQFWLSQGFTLVRIGIGQNKWHYRFALLMLKSLSPGQQQMIRQLQQAFIRHFNYYRVAYWQQDKAISAAIEQSTDWSITPSSCVAKQTILKAIDSVLLHYRDIHWVLPVINTWARERTLPDRLNPAVKMLLTGKFCHKKDQKNLFNTLFLIKKYIS